jgi:hypothetical protein
MRPLVAAALACALAAGCTDGYSRMDVHTIAVGDKLRGNFTGAQVTVPVGGVVVLHVTPYNSGDNPMVPGATTDDPATCGVMRAANDGDYALLGVHPGNTVVHLLADGSPESIVQVSVLAQ